MDLLWFWFSVILECVSFFVLKGSKLCFILFLYENRVFIKEVKLVLGGMSTSLSFFSFLFFSSEHKG